MWWRLRTRESWERIPLHLSALLVGESNFSFHAKKFRNLQRGHPPSGPRVKAALGPERDTSAGVG
jgi:hypothetical protein